MRKILFILFLIFSFNSDAVINTGSKITWLPPKKFYLCDNYHYSVTTPNSYIYPKLEISILDSTLTQGFTIFLRCGRFATPYNYDTRIDVPSGINKGSKIESKLPLCNFPLLHNNAYNIDIYIGNVDIEFTRRHYCPCSAQYIILSIGCLVEYNNSEIITLSPSSEYDISGFLTNKDEKSLGISDHYNLPLDNLKIISTPICVLENNFVTLCNANLLFSMQLDGLDGTQEVRNDGEMNISSNFCIYISPYFWSEEILKVMNDHGTKTDFQNSQEISNYEETNESKSLSSIPMLKNHLNSPFSPNICINIHNQTNQLISNEKLPSQLRNYIDSINIKFIKNYDSKDPKKIGVNFTLKNIYSSKYFIYPFMFQYNLKNGNNVSANFYNYKMKLHYSLNYIQYNKDSYIVKWLPNKIKPKYKVDDIPKIIESTLNINIKMNENFYVVVPKTTTNVLSFENNNLLLSIDKELHYLFDKYNSSLLIDYVGLLGRYPLDNNYQIIKDYELRESKIFNLAKEPVILDSSLINIANISMPTSIINSNLPYTLKINIKPIYPSELPIKSINVNLKHQVIPTYCNENTCSGHGDCRMNKYLENINIYCSCYPGWGGLYCSNPYLSYHSILAYPISLVGTNFVAIPTIYVCIYKRKWLVAFLAFLAGLVSSIFHAAEVGLLIDHGGLLLKGDLISAQLIISFVFILLCKFKHKIEITLLIAQIVNLMLLTIFTSRLTTTVIPIVCCFSLLFSRIAYWYFSTKLYTEKIPFENSPNNFEISCTIPIELTNTLNTPTNLICKEHHHNFNFHPEKNLQDETESNSNLNVPFDISKLNEVITLNSIVQNSNPISPINSTINTANNFIHRLQYLIINSYKKLLFIFKREYYSPKYVFIGFMFGAIGCITWFLETVDTYWIFHSLWHIMAFLASTFIIHGCIVPKYVTNDIGSEYNTKNNKSIDNLNKN